MPSSDSQDHRPAAAALDGSASVLVGVDIGGTKTAVCLSLNPPDVLWRHEFATRPEAGPAHALQSIIRAIQQGLRETGHSASAIGVSCGGPLDSTTGVIQRPPNLWTWEEVHITSLLAQEFGVPCALENDANAGALAEHSFGAGRGTEDMVFLTLGTGLGAGLILRGKLFRGACNMAGEIGHVRLTETGPVGYGKAGSIEGWASGGGMARLGASLIEEAIAHGERTTLVSKMHDLTARDIAAALQSGDAVAQRIVAASGARLGDALAMLVDILNPEKIVIGGLALRFGDHLLAPARASLRREALAAPVAACEIVTAELGERIGDVAALCIAAGIPVHD